MKQLLNFLECPSPLQSIHPFHSPNPWCSNPQPLSWLISPPEASTWAMDSWGRTMFPLVSSLNSNRGEVDHRHPHPQFQTIESLPRNPNNLQNLDFREIHLATSQSWTKKVFTRPNGQVSMVVRCPLWPWPTIQPSLFQYLAQLLQMENLQTLDVCGSSPTLVTIVIQAVDWVKPIRGYHLPEVKESNPQPKWSPCPGYRRVGWKEGISRGGAGGCCDHSWGFK